MSNTILKFISAFFFFGEHLSKVDVFLVWLSDIDDSLINLEFHSNWSISERISYPKFTQSEFLIVTRHKPSIIASHFGDASSYFCVIKYLFVRIPFHRMFDSQLTRIFLSLANSLSHFACIWETNHDSIIALSSYRHNVTFLSFSSRIFNYFNFFLLWIWLRNNSSWWMKINLISAFSISRFTALFRFYFCADGRNSSNVW